MRAQWRFIELRSGTGAAIIRLSESDARVSWIHAAGAQALALEVVVSGSDSDVNLPTTFASSAIFKVASGGSAYSVESFQPFEMRTDDDRLTVTHRIEIPRIA